MTKRVCSVEGCEGRHSGKGYCAVHYQRWRRLGTTELPPRRMCSVEGCDGVHRAKGLCDRHYAVHRRTEAPECRFDGCDAPGSGGKGLCAGHNAQRRRGAPLSPITRGGRCEEVGDGLKVTVPSGTFFVSAEDRELVVETTWWVASTGYVSATRNGQNVRLHRLILARMGQPVADGEHGDHIDRNPRNNRRSNLRRGSISGNRHNTVSREGSSIYRGVCWDISRDVWVAQVGLGGRRNHLGRFTSEREAGLAAARFRARHCPTSPDARGEGAFTAEELFPEGQGTLFDLDEG